MTMASSQDVPNDRVTWQVIVAALRPFVRRSVLRAAIVGSICAALAAAIGMVLEKSNVSFSSVPAATPMSIVWVVLAYLLFGSPFLAIGAAVKSENDAGLESKPDRRPGVRVYPAWWVRFLCVWVCWWLLVYLVVQLPSIVLWLKGESIAGDMNGGMGFGGIIGVFTFAGALGWFAIDGVIRLVEAAKLRRIKSVWMVISAAIGLFMSAVFCALLGVITWAINWTLVRIGLGSAWSMTTFLGLVPLAFIIGSLFGRGIFWDHHALPAPSRPRSWNPADMLTWDLESETSHAGTGANGYPYFIWRESADNRLGLSRPRFCTVVELENELQFVFYNPVALSEPKRWPLLAILLAIAIVVGMLVVDAVLPALFGWSPPFSGGRAYSVATLGTIGLMAMLLAGALTGLAYVAVTLGRWYRNRFEADGSFTTKPLSELSGFQAAPADRLMARGNPNATRSAEGLTAVFSDGTVWVLTSNAWEPNTVTEYHKELTNAFRAPRDQLLSAFAVKLKQQAQRSETPQDGVQRPGVSAIGVPETL